MIKIIDADDYNWGDPVVQLIKRARYGLTGLDRSLFEKRASQSLISQFDHLEFSPGEQPAHLYAFGSTEGMGPNRNFDGFPEKTACRQHHGTFVKFARWYREHANRKPEKSYGIVKASAFNAPMQRVELIVALNATKQAAEKNGGLVADTEMEKFHRGEPIGVSMACKIAHDFCSYCNNPARTRAEYCKEATCKAGGLSANMGRILSDGHILHAVNHEPRFFDISHVKKPADRIAYVTDMLNKSAAVKAAAWEHDMLPPTELFLDGSLSSLKLNRHVELLHKLACIEQELRPTSNQQLQTCGLAETVPMPKEARDNPQQAMRALAEVGGVLPLAGFLQLFGDQEPKEAAQLASQIGSELAHCFSDLLNNGDVQEQLATSNFFAAHGTSEDLRKWASEIRETVSLLPADVTCRSMSGAIRDRRPVSPSLSLIKSASTQTVARQYALYKSAQLLEFFPQNHNTTLTAELAIIQNLTL